MVILPEVLLLLKKIFTVLVVIPGEFAHCSFQLYEEMSWDFVGDCIESVDCFQQDGEFCYINPANQ